LYRVTHLRSLITLIHTLSDLLVWLRTRMRENLNPRALPDVGAAPALAESSASVELTGEAEGAIAVKTEALVPWAQGVAAREVEKLPQKAGSKVNEPPPEALPQKGERNPEALSRKRELERRSPERGRTRTRLAATRSVVRGTATEWAQT
jgi:hypothetical protein